MRNKSVTLPSKNRFMLEALFYGDKCAYSLFYMPLRSGIFVVHAYVLKPFFITCFRFEEILFDIRMSVFKNMEKGQGSEFSCLYAVVHMCHT